MVAWARNALGQHRRQLDVADACAWRPRPRARRCRAPPSCRRWPAARAGRAARRCAARPASGAVDAQIAAADRGGGEGDVGDRSREQARGVEMPRHAFHADGRQQPVRRLEAGDAADSSPAGSPSRRSGCRSRSGRSPRRRPPPSPTTSRPACARGLCGLRVLPGSRWANSVVTVLPISVPPARRISATSEASVFGR